MSQRNWRKRETRHFGPVWVAEVRVQLRAADGRPEVIDAQLDTGAVISLLKRSIGEVLGLAITEGRRIDLGSLAGDRVPAFVHIVPMRVDRKAWVNVPVAICEHDTVPNLLGRLGVLENFEIHLDPRRRETRISGPIG